MYAWISCAIQEPEKTGARLRGHWTANDRRSRDDYSLNHCIDVLAVGDLGTVATTIA
jgi:hypothetical protein